MARKRTTVGADEAIVLKDATEVPANTEGPPEPVPETVTTDEPDAPEGFIWLTYRGHANLLTFGDIQLRPGRPTRVSKDQAEGILTHPFEDVDVSMSQPEE